MSSITIRNLPAQAKEALRMQAAQCGLSLEAYTRHILKVASMSLVFETENITALSEKYFGEQHGVALSLPQRHSSRNIIKFDE